jgi:hypothetical protein
LCDKLIELSSPEMLGKRESRLALPRPSDESERDACGERDAPPPLPYSEIDGILWRASPIACDQSLIAVDCLPSRRAKWPSLYRIQPRANTKPCQHAARNFSVNR